MRILIFALRLILTLVPLLIHNTKSYSQELEDHGDFFRGTLKTPAPYTYNDYTSTGSVDIATGRFGINFPFFEISNEYIVLPIGLLYSTSGVKLDAISSEVGIDWNLYGQGSVTRLLKGRPDEIWSRLTENPCSGCSFGEGQLYSGKRSNFGQSSSVTFTSVNSLTTTPIFYGAAKNLRSNRFMSTFPNVGPINGNSATNEIETILLKKSFEGDWPPIDLERDLFKVSVGDQSFHFILKVKDEYKNSSSIIDNETDKYFEAICLDRKGAKISFKTAQIPYHKIWLVSDNTSGEHDPETNRVRTDKQVAIVSFEIVDTDGVKYIFDKYEFTESEYVNEYHDHSSQAIDYYRTIQYSLEDIYISKWELSRIILPNQEEINYTYIPNVYRYKNAVPRKHTGEYLGLKYNVKPEIIQNAISQVDTRIEGYEISEIDYAGRYKIIFTYSSDRPDLSYGGKNLTSMTLKDGNGITLRQFLLSKVFSYSDFYTDSRDRRMFLKKIEDSRKIATSEFEYKDINDLPPRTRILNQDIFGYYGGNQGGSDLDPAFPSFYISPDDESGNKITYEKPKSSYHVLFNGLNRLPNSGLLGFGVMESASFPTGGKLGILYEPNIYVDASLETGIGKGPGVRVQRLEYFDSPSDQYPKLKKTYQYDSGVLMFKPSFAYVTNYGYDNQKDRGAEQTKQYDGDVLLPMKIHFPYVVTEQTLRASGVTDKSSLVKKLTLVSTHSMGNQSDIFGREIIYKNVTERIVSPTTNTGNGYTKFTIFYEDNRTEVNVVSGPTDDNVYITPATPQTGYYYTLAGIWPWRGDTWKNENNFHLRVMYGFVEKKGYEIYPFPDRNHFGSKAGLLNGQIIQTETYSEDNSKTTMTSMIYDRFVNRAADNSLKNDFITNLSFNYLQTHVYRSDDPLKRLDLITDNNPPELYDYLQEASRNGGLHFFTLDKLEFESPLILSSKVSTQYSGNKDFSLQSTYLYDDFCQIVSKEQTGSTGSKHIETNKYPYDFTGVSAIESLVAANRLSEPIFVTSEKDGSIIKKSIDFKVWSNGLVLPEFVKSSKDNDSFINDVTVVSYDKYGNPTEVLNRDGVRECYIWGYRGEYPIVKVRGNISYQQIETIFTRENDVPISSLVEKSNQDIDKASENVLMNWLANLRVNLLSEQSEKLLISTYTHDPGVGVTSATDFNGKTVYYEYDSLSRLKLLKDDKGNILNTYEYHYKNQE